MDMGKVGLRISNLRKELGLSQEQVAQYLNIDQSMLSKIEKGERAITISSLEKLATLFCLSSWELFSADELSYDYNLAFRAKSLDEEDIIKLTKVNRIILNQRYMDSLLKGIR